jgi:hypothetical protein
MLTLDETTLFYFSLYSHPKTQKNVVPDWRTSVALFAPPFNNSNKAKARGPKSLPSLTTTTTASSTVSSLTNDIWINDNDQGSTDLTWSHGIDDEDETHGEERDAAASSPIKGKVRLRSSVSRS